MIAQKMKTLMIFWFIFMCLFPESKNLSAQNSKWILKKRIQLGFELDDNFRESTFNPQSEPCLRLLFQIAGKRYSSRSFLSLSYSGGYQGYEPLVREDKFINELNLQSEYQLLRRFNWGIVGRMRTKMFLYSPYNYMNSSVQLYFKLILPLNFQLYFLFKQSYLNHAQQDLYNYTNQDFSVVLNHRFSERWLLECMVSGSAFDFNRRAYIYYALTESIKPIENKQYDTLEKYIFSLNYFGFILGKISYAYETNSSNSYGFAFNSHGLIFSAAKRLFSNCFWRSSAMLQYKKYVDQIPTIIPHSHDYEEINSNYLIADFSYDFSRSTSGFVRLSWYHNESPFRAAYYEKRTAAFGLDYQF